MLIQTDTSSEQSISIQWSCFVELNCRSSEHLSRIYPEGQSYKGCSWNLHKWWRMIYANNVPQQAIRSQAWWVWEDRALSDVLISSQAGQTECSHCINMAGSALFIFRFSQSDAYTRATKPPLLSLELGESLSVPGRPVPRCDWRIPESPLHACCCVKLGQKTQKHVKSSSRNYHLLI